VWAVRVAREGEKWSTKASAGIYYWLMRHVALPTMPAKGADFLLVDRKVIDAYNRIGEKNTSMLGMILWMGFRQSFIPYVKQARYGGRSKWTFAKRFKLFVDSVVSFSYLPIRAMSLVGLGMALAGFLYAVVVVVGRLAGWINTGTGFAALMTAVLAGQGVIMAMLGVLGEYVWRAYDEARGRPQYIIEEHVHADESADSSLLPIELRRAAS
jgi:dolichol-phosphate mannosyltransferase